jgi:hypothetical protein
MAQAYGQMKCVAYDALLHHGINYRDLPAYKDTTLLAEAEGLVLAEGRAKYMLWMERITNAIDAAIRRKTFRVTRRDDT